MSETINPSIDPKKLIHQPENDTSDSFTFGIEDLNLAREAAYAENAYIDEMKARGYNFNPNFVSGDGSVADAADRAGNEALAAGIMKRAMELVPKASLAKKEAVAEAALSAVSIEYRRSCDRYKKYLAEEQARLDDEATAIEKTLLDISK